MKKILIIQESLGGGGAERVLINILKKFDYKKYEVELFLLFREGVYLSQVPKEVKITYLFNQEIKKYYKLKRAIIKLFPGLIYKKCINDKYDTEIAFVEGLATKVLSKSKNKLSNKIAWVHIDLKKLRTMSKRAEKKCYEKMNHIICVSFDAMKNFNELYGELRHKSKVIYNLINKEEIENLAVRKIDYKFDKSIVVAVGRLTDQKRFDILIKAHKKLLEDNVEAKLLILGVGPNEEQLKLLIKKLKIEKNVSLLGFIDNPYPYINNATVFAMSSDYEGLPLVITEALVLGKAIVSTNCTGPSELLDEGKYGLLTECGDENKLKEAIKSLIINNEYRSEMELKALSRSLIFNEDKILLEIESIL